MNVKTASGEMLPFRLDSGPQVTCITEQCRERLRLRSQNADIKIYGIGGNFAANAGSIVSLQIIPPYHESISVTAVVLDSVTKDMPSYPIDSRIFESIKHLQWAYPHFMIPSAVDIIIGSDIYERILDEGKAITRT